MLQDLKQFLLRGNVVDLAVAVIIGAAFTLVVNSFVDDVLMALIGAFVGEPNFNDLTLGIGDGVIFYGRFLTTVVNFAIVGMVLFLVVRALQSLLAQRAREPEPEAVPDDVRLLTEIRDELRRRP
jgi:large conductance mechanosensitive channel